MTDRPNHSSTDRRLADIVREVKIAAADRTDVVVDMRDADRARLELLAQEIRPVIDEIDPTDDRFDFGISPGLQPRLWIDSVAHVHMGADRRVFRFVRDTRLGRVLMSDSSDIAKTADAVARYIAERVIERERILAGDFETMKAEGFAGFGAESRADDDDQADLEADRGEETGSGFEAANQDEPEAPVAAAMPGAAIATLPSETGSKPGRGAGFVLGASWFILGCVAGAAALVVAFWDRLSAMIN